MAIIHRASISPTKLELLQAWVPDRSWYAGDAPLTLVGAYRFDDPAGEVGIETHLVHAGGPVMQIPLTYRGAPLPGGEASLVATMEHSVLGRRWIYNACADPVYIRALSAAVVGGGGEAPEFVESDGGPMPRPATVSVRGSGTGDRRPPVVGSIGALAVSTTGTATTCALPGLDITVRRVIDSSDEAPGDYLLTGTWADQPDPVHLAGVRLR